MKIELAPFDYHGMSSTRSSAGQFVQGFLERELPQLGVTEPTTRRYLDLLAGLFMVPKPHGKLSRASSRARTATSRLTVQRDAGTGRSRKPSARITESTVASAGLPPGDSAL